MEAQIRYEDFDLLIEPASSTEYRARVLRSPAGESSPVQFTLPFSSVELENFVLRVGHGGRRTRRGGRPEIAPLKDFGGKLYDALFKDELRETLQRSLSLTRAQRAGMRLRLRLTDAPELAGLPWEFLYDPRHNRFLAQSRRTALVRYLDLPDPPRPLTVEGPLRLLVMISSPSGYPELDVEHEWDVLTGALAEPQAAGRVIVERLAANMGALRHRLRRDEFHVFHFVGHGFYRPDWGDGVLVMEDRGGRPHEVTGEELGGLLNEYDATRLAVLNACEGARSSAGDPFSGVAQSLLQQGLPATVAMQFEITDDAAIIFAYELYGAIADGYPLEAALAEARGAIRDEGNPVEWGTPVLYSRAPDGRLFDLSPRDVRPDGNTESRAPQRSPKGVRADTKRAARFLADAERIAQSITGDDQKIRALAGVATALAATDPDRATLLFASLEPMVEAGSKPLALKSIGKALVAADPDRAERIARSITSDYPRAWALARVAMALAAADPDRAERIAQSVTDDYAKATALTEIATALMATDPDRAGRLFADAERSAQSITTETHHKVETLAGIGAALMATDPDRAGRLFADAERSARSITDTANVPPPYEFFRGAAFGDIAKALATTDPDRAVRLAQDITDKGWKVDALVAIAVALTAADPDRAGRLFADAERIAQSITDDFHKDEALNGVARALTATDPDRAVRVAQSITDESDKAVALADVAKELAAADPDRAERIAQSATDGLWVATALADIAVALTAADPDRAGRLFADAERVAQSVTDESHKAIALANVARALAAAADPNYVERDGQSILEQSGILDI